MQNKSGVPAKSGVPSDFKMDAEAKEYWDKVNNERGESRYKITESEADASDQ